ncbi:2-succinyl-6-hydroxy-2,4-cyclohexadiene-1-carboxylate synthase [Bacillus sp. FJAT-49736]|uniref:2-succinyl-6-hydroxy-2, 4-cyclohexadiene-1-carboxylate synthase n=1 Tax=Bacillus sp. FJAT-49736 TaxID=2833582 RepID=UPI001BC95390|nr:2-succinyl-6-hydroxy-2,4-cyclohexadiene-1-carboxylate synthase [Bacillus sp. FJAT-49736]MBS4173903.1 2-succinyl-6-hydroxy-2,4-cyclohexadiene-1-carboxylate synthase [Bacillus sp. FJAT-49736]
MLININDVSYHVEIIGDGEPVVLLHGFTGDTSTWKDLAGRLKGKYKVLLVDIVGHGLTESPAEPKRYNIELVADDLKDIMQKFAMHDAAILGYSMGGRLALTFAQKYPEMTKKLILESATPGLMQEKDRIDRRARDKQLADRILEDGIEAFVDYWANIPLFQSQKLLDASVQSEIRLQRLANNPIGLANSLLGMGTGSQPSWWNTLSRLQMPILLITGELDKKFCLIADEMKKCLLHAEWITMPRVGHAIHVESPKKFGTIVMEFLAKSDI